MRQIRAITVTRGRPMTLTRTGWGRKHTVGSDADPLWELQVHREGAASKAGNYT